MSQPVSKTKRKKHLPQRTCIGCREVLPKRLLIRIVRTPDGIDIDPTGKIAGRGAYLHNKHSCWVQGLKGSIAHALRTDLSDQDRTKLVEYKDTLPKDDR